MFFLPLLIYTVHIYALRILSDWNCCYASFGMLHNVQCQRFYYFVISQGTAYLFLQEGGGLLSWRYFAPEWGSGHMLCLLFPLCQMEVARRDRSQPRPAERWKLLRGFFGIVFLASLRVLMRRSRGALPALIEIPGGASNGNLEQNSHVWIDTII